MTPEEELGKVALVLLLERREEERRMAAVIANKSIREKREEGLSWYPIEFKSGGYGSAGDRWVEFERAHASSHPVHQFSSGSPVRVYNPDEPEETFNGMVAFVKNDRVKVVFRGDDAADNFRDGKWAMDVRFDDKTFFEMEKALSTFINVGAGPLMTLRNKLLGYTPLESVTLAAVQVDGLNESQKEAIKVIIGTKDVAVVHGPPGTGKTTTLTHAIKALAPENKILVCAPSNTAVDHIVMKLTANGVDVVRLGHPARMSDDVLVSSMDRRMERSPEQKLIRELQKRADDARKEADKYKRTFGAEERKMRNDLRQEARSLEKEAKALSIYAEQKILDACPVIACTLIGSTDDRLENIQFDYVIIDEAAQALEPACWVPIKKAGKVVLAGDPWQLPPTVKSYEAAEKGLDITLIQKVIERCSGTVLLNEQYRMNSVIMEFSNQRFYKGLLSSHASVADHRLDEEEDVIEFIDTAGCGFEEVRSEVGESLTNPEEATLLVRHLEQLLERRPNIHTVGVISPYRAQVELLQSLLPDASRIVVQTVDGFQGQEREVIYISLVRSNDSGQIGFLSDYRRMNVAMTRAKKKLVIIGDSATLGNDSFYNDFLEYCESINAYHTAWEWL